MAKKSEQSDATAEYGRKAAAAYKEGERIMRDALTLSCREQLTRGRAMTGAEDALSDYLREVVSNTNAIDTLMDEVINGTRGDGRDHKSLARSRMRGLLFGLFQFGLSLEHVEGVRGGGPLQFRHHNARTVYERHLLALLDERHAARSTKTKSHDAAAAEKMAARIRGLEDRLAEMESLLDTATTPDER